MDDLPELPFEKVLSYLSLKDRLKSRAVSRRWYHKIDSLRVKTLCYSKRPSEFIFQKSRLISGAFAQNFISSIRFECFFGTFGQSILSNLKHLRLCSLLLKEQNRTALTEALQSFAQLEELDLIHFGFPVSLRGPGREFELTLPMLTSIHIGSFSGVGRLTLDAPGLQKVRHGDCLRLDLVHVQSVERVTIDKFLQMTVKDLKNLKYLYVNYLGIDPTLLSGLEQLREIHLNHRDNVTEIFEQKRRYGRSDLKVYLYGLLLNGSDDPQTNARFSNYREMFVHWAENTSRLADEIPFYRILHYSAIERVAPELAINLVNRFTDLDEIIVDRPVQDVERFLAFLKNFSNISELRFYGDQPQDLFDRLPEHCTVQKLVIHRLPPNLEFLIRLKHLIKLDLSCAADVELIRRIFEELEFVTSCVFFCVNNSVKIETDLLKKQRGFRVWVNSLISYLPDLDTLVRFIIESNQLVV